MIKAGGIDKGMFLLFKGEPYLVAEREFVNPGKGSAFVRVKLKSLLNGSVQRPVLKSHESVEEASVEDRETQYLYSDGTSLHFMDTDSYEQFEIAAAEFEEKSMLMKDGESYTVVMWEDTPIDIKIPLKEVYEVTEAEHAIKGDTATGATKLVTLQTGLTVKVPLFIKQGERVLINTETLEYVERVNN